MKTRKGRVSKNELAAAVTMYGDDVPNSELNYLLNNHPRKLIVGDVESLAGKYILPVTYKESGETVYLTVPTEISERDLFRRYFENVNPVLATDGEITDLVGAPAREAWEGVLELRKQYGNPRELQTYFEFNTQDGLIHGSELRTMILLNKYLAGKNARTLTFQEGMEEDKKGKLSNGVFREFGIAVYSPANPHQELAERLIQEGRRRGYELPILVHPAALDLAKNGVEILLARDFSPELVVSGEQAKIALEKFDWKGDFGVRRVYRGRGGDWGAAWDAVFRSGADCRMDKVRGVAAHAKNSKK